MAVNDEIYKNLAEYGGGTINERVNNYLGSLGYTGSLSDRLAQYEFEGSKGWLGLTKEFPPQRMFPFWTPAALFSQGQQGVWYEPRPEYLYQDAAGTVPVTADGDPVGYMQDLSGNGNHATQSTSAARPVYRTDGVLHWLELDGVDDFIEFDASFLRSRASILCGISHGGYTGTSTRYSLSSRSTGDLILLGFRFQASSREIRARRESSDNQTNFTLPSGSDRYSNIAFSDYQSGKLRAWQGGAYMGEENYDSTGLSSEAHSAGHIGALNSGFNFNGKIWGVLYTVDEPEHEGVVNDISAYLTNLAGVQL